MKKHRVKVVSGNPGNIEGNVNEWLLGEGAGMEIRSINTCGYTFQKSAADPVLNRMTVTIWYEEP